MVCYVGGCSMVFDVGLLQGVPFVSIHYCIWLSVGWVV